MTHEALMNGDENIYVDRSAVETYLAYFVDILGLQSNDALTILPFLGISLPLSSPRVLSQDPHTDFSTVRAGVWFGSAQKKYCSAPQEYPSIFFHVLWNSTVLTSNVGTLPYHHEMSTIR